MDIDAQTRDGVTILALSGRVRSSEVAVLMARLAQIKQDAEKSTDVRPRVVLDLAGLDNLPTAVVGALIEAIRSVETVGGRFALATPTQTVSVALDRLGIAQLVTTFDSVDKAVAALRADTFDAGEDTPAG